METHVFFLHLLIILLSARLLAEVAVALRAPAVIGELAAGVILGPSLLGVMEPNEVLRMLAEIGIILLLFEVGLETDIQRLVRAGNKSLVVAIGGLVAPFLLGLRSPPPVLASQYACWQTSGAIMRRRGRLSLVPRSSMTYWAWYCWHCSMNFPLVVALT
jgi:hypothetical protein